MRILIHTGKGGVGKTTVAAATAVELARRGRRTLVMSTDAAHSLGDSLGVRLGNDPVSVAPNLDAAEIDALAENDRAWGGLRDYFGRLLTHTAGPSLLTDEMLVLPGLTDLFSLLRILDVAESSAYDTLVVDCAPTGETLSLLNYPERLTRLIELALPTKRAMAKALGKPIEKLTSVPMPEDRLFDDVLNLTSRLRDLGTLLRDDSRTTLRLVTTPERIVVAEARRNLTWLTLFGFTVDGVIVNRVYPADALDGYFAPWAASQDAGLALIDESFAHVPVWRLPLQSREVTGLDALGAVGGQLYTDADPSDTFFHGDFYRVTRTGDTATLRVALPQAAKERIELSQEGDDVVLAYAGARRRIALPDSLRGTHVTRARYDTDALVLSLD